MAKEKLSEEATQRLQKSFESLGVNAFVISQKVKSPIEKAFDCLEQKDIIEKALPQDFSIENIAQIFYDKDGCAYKWLKTVNNDYYFKDVNTNNQKVITGEKQVRKTFSITPASDEDLINKSMDTSKLIKKKVTIHGKNGKIYQGYRWVEANSGTPAQTSVKETKDIKEFKEKKLSAKTKPEEVDKEIDEKISGVSESGGTKANKVRDYIALGVYDPSFIMQMDESLSINNVKDYLKEAGLDYKKFQDNVASNVNIALGNSGAEVKEMAVSKMQETMKSKDVQAELKRRKEERAKELGITGTDKFDAYKFKLDQLIGERMMRSLIVYGTGGIGKTWNLEKKLEEYGKVGYDPELDLQPSEYDYVKITGNTSPTDLYNLMYENPKKLIVFDDCDSMWGDEKMANMLKGALDSTGDRMIRYANPKKLADGTKPPQMFKFNGQVIFISNLTRDKFDQPLIDSRSGAIDLTMTMDQTLEMLDGIKDSFQYKDVDGKEISITPQDRTDIMQVLHDLKDDLRIEQVNGRVLGNLAAMKVMMKKKGGKTDYNTFKIHTMIALDLV